MTYEIQRKTFRNMIVPYCARFLLAAFAWMSCCTTVWADRTVSDGYGQASNDSGDETRPNPRYYYIGNINEKVTVTGRLAGYSYQDTIESDTSDAFEFTAMTSEITYQVVSSSNADKIYEDYKIEFFPADFMYVTLKSSDWLAFSLMASRSVYTIKNLTVGERYRNDIGS